MLPENFSDTRQFCILKFPKFGGTPRSSVFGWIFILNHPAIGVPPFMETPTGDRELAERLLHQGNVTLEPRPARADMLCGWGVKLGYLAMPAT